MAAPFDAARTSGMSRLLVHCEAVARADQFATARSRLEQALGSDLAHRLVSALSYGHARTVAPL
jgi:hypothetical protein